MFLNLFDIQNLTDFEANKLINIPEIKKNYETKRDVIDIIDFQDTFGIFYEYIIRTELDFTKYSIEELDDLFESQLSNIRSNKLLKTNDSDSDDFNKNYSKKNKSKSKKYKITSSTFNP